jgi:hypothetical protein
MADVAVRQTLCASTRKKRNKENQSPPNAVFLFGKVWSTKEIFLQPKQATNTLFAIHDRDRRIQEAISSLSNECVYVVVGKSKAQFHGQHGYAVADKKYASLRSAPSDPVLIHGNHFSRHLDAVFAAACWAVLGPEGQEESISNL